MISRDQAEESTARRAVNELGTECTRRPHTPEEIAAKLRQVGVLVGQGRLVTEAVHAVGVSASTYYRWRAAHRGQATDQEGATTHPEPDQAQRLRRLEVENTRLRRAVAELAIEKQALKEAGPGFA